SPIARISRQLEEILFLVMTGFTNANDRRRRAESPRRREQIALQRIIFQPGKRDDLRPFLHPLARTFTHRSDARLAPRVGRFEWKACCRMLFDGKTPVFRAVRPPPAGLGRLPAPAVGPANPPPLAMPSLVVARPDTLCSQKTFRNRRAALLGGRKKAHELG